MAMSKQSANKSTGGKAPRDLLATFATRKAAGSLQILRRDKGDLTIHYFSAQVPFSNDEIGFRTLRNRHITSRLLDLFGRTDEEKLTKSGKRNTFLTFSNGFTGVGESGIGLFESVNHEKDYGPLGEDPDWVVSLIWLSTGEINELAGVYHAKSEEDDTSYSLSLCTMEWSPLVAVKERSGQSVASINDIPCPRGISQEKKGTEVNQNYGSRENLGCH